MKKIIIILLSILAITGCENMRNTPTSKVEDFLGKYQRMDTDVIEDLKISLSKDKHMTTEQKKEYQALLEKQYQNLSYKIKKEDIIDNNATIEVEIEVFDYQTSINNSKRYYEEHLEEFEDNKKYLDYKISELKKVTTKVKENITFHLTKEKNIWTIEELNEKEISKIHGLY